IRQRPLIDIDRDPFARAIDHRPIAVAAHAAADIEKAQAAPIRRREMHRPAAELLLVFREEVAISAPFIAEPVGRSGLITPGLVDHQRHLLSSRAKRRPGFWSARSGLGPAGSPRP